MDEEIKTIQPSGITQTITITDGIIIELKRLDSKKKRKVIMRKGISGGKEKDLLTKEEKDGKDE